MASDHFKSDFAFQTEIVLIRLLKTQCPLRGHPILQPSDTNEWKERLKKNSNYVVTNRKSNSGNYKSESSSSYDNIDVSSTKTENRNATEKTQNRALLEEFISRRNDSTAQIEDRIRVKPKPKPNVKVILHVNVVDFQNSVF